MAPDSATPTAEFGSAGMILRAAMAEHTAEHVAWEAAALPLTYPLATARVSLWDGWFK